MREGKVRRGTRLATTVALGVLTAFPQQVSAGEPGDKRGSQEEPWSKDKIAGVTLFAVGSAAIVASSTVTALAYWQQSRLLDSSIQGPLGFSPNEWNSDLARARPGALALSSWVLFPVGVVALFAGTLVLRRDNMRRRGKPTNVRASVTLLQTGGGLGVRMRF
jgi:hypothetical protein